MKKVLFLWVILVCLTGVFAMNSCGDSNHVCTLDTNISSSATWIDGNTYVLLSDINVTGSGTVLTISPGAVVKYGPTSLNVLNGGRIVATGTAAKRIYFLSCRDQNVFAGVSNADTSTIPGCSGPPNGADYKHALWIQSDAEMTSGDDLAFLTIGDANQAIQLDLSIGAVHDNNFFNIKQQNPAFTHIGIYTTAGSSAAFYDNVFQNFSTGYGLFLDGGAAASNIFNNRFDNLSGGVGIYLPQNFSGNIYNNLFENPLTISIFNNATFTGTVYNNMFVNLGAGNIAIFNNATFEGLTRRNLFANVSTAFSGVFSGTVSHNAFFNVATHGGSAANHAADQNSATGFTTDPFIADNTDRNFLLNTVSTGGQKLADAGGVDSNSIDLNNFFNLRTTQNGNKLDTNKVDIGYHYDQNAPYVVVRSPSDFNSLTGTQSIDFNVESGFGIASGITAALAYSTTSSGSGTSILSQALSAFACSALPVASCSYAWDTTSVTDGNYFVRLAGT
ncbi:MAG: hypothetical protein J4215_06290, partial [Candidatus Diapherotrites archaeon]|nr:hypothetical protein [Candidatus Diapherotrites archaeon]